MRSCSPRRPRRWNAATGAIARCKATSIVYERKRRSVRALRWTCGVKPRPKGVDKPSYHSIMHGLDKPGVFTTVSSTGEEPTRSPQTTAAAEPGDAASRLQRAGVGVHVRL